MKTLLATGLLVLGSSSWLEIPAKIESWLFNARERTQEGLVAIEEGNPEAAAEALDTAARLAPRDPVARFNAGTGRLLAEREGAVEELVQAADLAGADLLPRALYNLGTAQLQADDPAAAVESFKSSLRLAPSQSDAKHNLELAQQALEQQQSGQVDDEETPESEGQGEEEQSSAEGSEDPPRDHDREGDESSDEPNPQGQPEPDETQQRPLPNFEDQPDMTAEQAAAILEAVENLEREQRQQQAAERMKNQRKGDRDW